uniref:WAP domain-containing protein n=1 Tax=Crocodylus porosus TaxID=8502 RepID=A0A7M4EL45_CROPO
PRKPASPDFAPCPNQCEDDRTCPGDEKCCFTGCGLGCMSPYKGTDRGCPAMPTAQPKGPCLDACLDDSECPGDEKCCDTGCGHHCQAPHSGTDPRHIHSPPPPTGISAPQDPCLGKNPPRQVLGVGGRTGPAAAEPWPRGPSSTTFPPGTCPLLLRGSLGPCMETCRSDWDCAGVEKCCSTSCGHICKPPIAGKGGVGPWTIRAATDWGGPWVRLGPSPARLEGRGAGSEQGLPCSFLPCNLQHLGSRAL